MTFLSDLEHLHHSNEVALKKYQENTKKNLVEALSKLHSNQVLHTQVATGPLNLSQVNFNCLQMVTVESMNFNAYIPKGNNWKSFKKKWRQSINFFIFREPKIDEAISKESDASE
ncbi:hypothetical protein PVK06_047455 [Gossypium arboreum]|uniref:Uncharacterized protein n=1 Tax=Gossypium arboreum TaxID=29729 RepID=A0ABR0MDC8_GOSAR|nr:hypothetical protein PVK06_047455 [Gossypium arboreum]